MHYIDQKWKKSYFQHKMSTKLSISKWILKTNNSKKFSSEHCFSCKTLILISNNLLDEHKQPRILWVHYLKLQSVSFASLSSSLFETLELQLCVELSSVRGVVLRHGFSVDESNVLRSMCVSLSVTKLVWILYLGITDSSLRLGVYDPKKNFTVYCRLNK